MPKISGCWYKAKPYMDKHSLLSLHYSYIIPILTTEILHEEVQSRQNLTKIYNQQKHAIRIV